MPPFRRQKQSPELSDRLVLGIASSPPAQCLPFTPRNDGNLELSKRILSGAVASEQKIVVDAVDGEIVFWNPKKEKAEV